MAREPQQEQEHEEELQPLSVGFGRKWCKCVCIAGGTQVGFWVWDRLRVPLRERFKTVFFLARRWKSSWDFGFAIGFGVCIGFGFGFGFGRGQSLWKVCNNLFGRGGGSRLDFGSRIGSWFGFGFGFGFGSGFGFGRGLCERFERSFWAGGEQARVGLRVRLWARVRVRVRAWVRDWLRLRVRAQSLRRVWNSFLGVPYDVLIWFVNLGLHFSHTVGQTGLFGFKWFQMGATSMSKYGRTSLHVSRFLVLPPDSSVPGQDSPQTLPPLDLCLHSQVCFAWVSSQPQLPLCVVLVLHD